MLLLFSGRVTLYGVAIAISTASTVYSIATSSPVYSIATSTD